MNNTITIPALLGKLKVANTENSKANLNHISCQLDIAADLLEGRMNFSEEITRNFITSLRRDSKRIYEALKAVGYFDNEDDE